MTLPQNAVHTLNAELYPYNRTIVVDLSEAFEEPPTETELKTEALDYMDRNDIGKPKVNIDVSFVPLWQTEDYKDIAALERVNLFDTVTVEFEQLGVSAKAKVIKTDYDVLKERYVTVSIGDVRSSLATTLAEQEEEVAEEIKTTQTRVEKGLTRASNLLTGGLGGNVVINRDADGKPIEILIMDTKEKSTAVNVLRLNMNGIAFSQNGYDGPFTSAWTIDGTMDMQNIEVVNLVADLIRGGTLRLGDYEGVSGILQLYDANNALIGQMDENGLRMYGQDGAYVLMNEEVGFAGYDQNGDKTYWVDGDEFHMRKGVMTEEITICDIMRFIRMQYTDTDESGSTYTRNDGIGLVSVAGLEDA